MIKKTIRAQNKEAELKGGIKVGGLSKKEKSTEVLFREALAKESNSFLKCLMKELENNYSVLRAYNAKYSSGLDRDPSPSTIEMILRRYKKIISTIFKKNIKKISKRFIKKLSISQKKQLSEDLKKMVGSSFRVSYNKEEYGEALKVMVARNVSLITNTAEKSLSDISTVVYNAITSGQGWSEVTKDLSRIKGMTDKRIKGIARDQTAKFNADFNQLEQKNAGIKFFRWETARDERVSTGKGGHKQLEGKIYKWGDEKNYPVIDSYGHRGLPSQRPFCRCRAAAVILDDGWEMVQNPDGSYTPKKI